MKVGDKVRVIKGKWEGCTGVIDKYNYLTGMFVTTSLEGYNVNPLYEEFYFYPEELQVIEDYEVNIKILLKDGFATITSDQHDSIALSENDSILYNIKIQLGDSSV